MKTTLCKVLSLLLCLTLLLPLLPVQVHGTDCDHSYADGLCTICGAECTHTYDNNYDGICTSCGMECEHQWYNGACSICNMPCLSNEFIDGICPVCGWECYHEFQSDGICYICGMHCPHYWEYGSCTICGSYCMHENWVDAVCQTCQTVCDCRVLTDMFENGVCWYCGSECNHAWWEGVCEACHLVCEHLWLQGDCVICDISCTHSYSEGVCTNCAMEENAPDAACLRGDFNNWAYEANMVEMDCVHLGVNAYIEGGTDQKFALIYQDRNLTVLGGCHLNSGLNDTTYGEEFTVFFKDAPSGNYLFMYNRSTKRFSVYNNPSELYIRLNDGELIPMTTDGNGHFTCVVDVAPGTYQISHTDGKEFSVQWYDFLDLELTEASTMEFSVRLYPVALAENYHVMPSFNRNVLATESGCIHRWEEGVCSTCGESCSHSYESGICTVCGMTCTHSYESGTCTVCGVTCTHSYESGTCTVCGVTCTHSYESGTCTICGMSQYLATGSCGEQLTWTLSYDGVLVISGTGPMVDYEYYDSVWTDHYSGQIQTVIVEPGVTSIGKNAFCGCKMSSVTLSETVTEIGTKAFYDCGNIKQMDIPGPITTLSSGVFMYCSGLTDIVVPDTVTVIESEAFSHCSSMTRIDIPASVTQISNTFVFNDCDKLEGIWVDENNPAYCNDENGVLFNKDRTKLIRVPATFTAYEIPQSVTAIEMAAFQHCYKIKEVTIPEGITMVDAFVFEHCTGLEVIELPTTLTSIGVRAFANCQGLETIGIPRGVTHLYDEAFMDCLSLEQVTLPEGLTCIGRQTFCNCISLTEITLPKSLEQLKTAAFSNCIELSGITFCGSTPDIASTTFRSVTAKAYYPANNPSWTEKMLQNYGGKLTWEGYEAQMVKPVLTLKYPTVSFEDEVKINVYFTAEFTEDVLEMGMITYTQQVEQWNAETAEQIIQGSTYNPENGMYCANTQGLAAKDLGETVYFSVYAKLIDGSYVYTGLASYSPQNYATSVLNNEAADPALKSVVVSMLQYSAAAQVYFGTEEGDAQVELTEEMLALIGSYREDMIRDLVRPEPGKLGSFAATSTGFAGLYPTISFEGAFCINYYFKPSAPVSGDMKLYVWDAATYESVQELTADNASQVLTMTGETEYMATVADIPAKALDDTVYVAAVYTDGVDTYCSGVLSYSIGAYCAAQIANGSEAMKNLAAAVAVYGYYAKAYFAS